jgi:hypothetical protein
VGATGDDLETTRRVRMPVDANLEARCAASSASRHRVAVIVTSPASTALSANRVVSATCAARSKWP